MALELWLDKNLIEQKSMYVAIGDDCLVFPVTPSLYSLLFGYGLMENHFSEVKETSNSFIYELPWH